MLKYAEQNNMFTIAYAYMYLFEILLKMEQVLNTSLAESTEVDILKSLFTRLNSISEKYHALYRVETHKESSEKLTYHMCLRLKQVRNCIVHEPHNIKENLKDVLELRNKQKIVSMFSEIMKVMLIDCEKTFEQQKKQEAVALKSEIMSGMPVMSR